MSEFMYSALPPLPTYPRRPSQPNKKKANAHQSSQSVDDTANSRRSFIRPVSRSSSGSVGRLTKSRSNSSAAGTNPNPDPSHESSAATATADLDVRGLITPGGADGARGRSGARNAAEQAAQSSQASDPRASTSTGGSGQTRVAAASIASSAGSSGSTFVPRGKRKPAAGKVPPLPNTRGINAGDLKNVAMYPESDANRQREQSAGQREPGQTKHLTTVQSFPRTESVSSTSVTTAVSTRTVTSTDPSGSEDHEKTTIKPFTQRNGRSYLNDPSLPYPLPIDLTELHRQSLRTLLLIQVHGAPVASPHLQANPPTKVLEIGCGPGFWSQMCHRYYKSRGHDNIQFVGIDIAPLAPGSANLPSDSIKPDRDMNWTFIQHDLRQAPWPFEDGEFDMILNKDNTLSITLPGHPQFTEECLRLLKTGGTLEIWETDHTIRMLRPHVPSSSALGAQAEAQEAAASLGAYMININTPLSAPLNTFLVEYNNWLNRALEARELMPNPCTLVNHYLLSETDSLTGIGSHRVAIPLSEVRWEREGVGGVVTKDGKSYVNTKDRDARAPHQKVERKTLTAGQAALRKTALLTLVEEIQALEPILREVSGKSQDEWDVWMGKMMNDLMSENGTSWGECLESGAWWARKI